MIIKKLYTLIYLLLLVLPTAAQSIYTPQQAIDIALKNNLAIKNASLNIEQQQLLKKSALEIPKTDIAFMQGQYNSYVKSDNNITITQTIPFPTVWTSQHALSKAMVTRSEFQQRATKNDIIYKVSLVSYQLLYLKSRHALLTRQDSIYKNLVKAATLRHETGESGLLEKISAETQWNETQNLLHQLEADLAICQSQLKVLLATNDQSIDITGDLETLPVIVDTISTIENPTLCYFKQQIDVTKKQKKIEAARILPDLKVGYFNQTLIGYQIVNGQEQYFDSSHRFQGFEVGISFPLWFVPYIAKVKAAGIQQQMAQQEYELQQQVWQGELEQAYRELAKAQQSLDYYINHALPTSDKLLQHSHRAFKAGEIDYTTHLVNLKNALSIRDGYLNALHDAHANTLKIDYLTGNSRYKN